MSLGDMVLPWGSRLVQSSIQDISLAERLVAAAGADRGHAAEAHLGTAQRRAGHCVLNLWNWPALA